MKDFQLQYPLYSDFQGKNEHLYPALFNYVCLSGRQIFLTKVRKSYHVLIRAWTPPEWLYPDQQLFRELVPYYRCKLVYKTGKYLSAKCVFHNLVRRLLCDVSASDYLLEVE